RRVDVSTAASVHLRSPPDRQDGCQGETRPMTRNQQLTIGVIVLVAVAVYLVQDAAKKTETIKTQNETIDAQRRQVNAAEFGRTQAEARVSMVAAERDRYLAKIGELEQQLRNLSPAPAGSPS